MSEIIRKYPNETAQAWQTRRDALPDEAIIEVLFEEPIPEKASMHFLLRVGYYGDTHVLTQDEKIVGLRAPKSVWLELVRR